MAGMSSFSLFVVDGRGSAVGHAGAAFPASGPFNPTPRDKRVDVS
jgi:hypothetical protein